MPENAGEEAAVKEAVRELLNTPKVEVLLTIARVLYQKLPDAYDAEWYEQKVGQCIRMCMGLIGGWRERIRVSEMEEGKIKNEEGD